MKNNEPIFHLFDTTQSLHQRLAAKVATDLSDAIETKGFASLMLSGGNTPKPFLEELAKEPLVWEHVHVGLVDERWVDESNEASNARLVKEHLIEKGAQNAKFVGMYCDGETAESATHRVEKELRNTLFPFDVVILGMGKDGHTASLFPHNEKLTEGLDLQTDALCVVMQPDDAPHLRMSLTLNAINSSAHCYLHIEGGEKLAVYREALGGMDEHAMPIRAVLKNVPIEIYYS